MILSNNLSEGGEETQLLQQDPLCSMTGLRKNALLGKLSY